LEHNFDPCTVCSKFSKLKNSKKYDIFKINKGCNADNFSQIGENFSEGHEFPGLMVADRGWFIIFKHVVYINT
jgi:hypothetical protein